MKIQNAFRFGLFGGLGVLVALGIGTAVGTLATIITYIGAAIFLALGLDPAVSWLEKHRFPRWLAILTVREHRGPGHLARAHRHPGQPEQ